MINLNTNLSFRLTKNNLTILCVFLFISTCLGQQEIKQQTQTTINNMVSKIKTAVDPEFVYNYDKTKFVPEEGKTLLIMGQTVESTNEYMERFPNQPIPGGWSAYWGITEFKGVAEYYRNEVGGSADHQMLVDRFPNTVIQSAMWMVGTWDIAEKAASGAYDKVIKKYCRWAKSIKRPVYLRIGYEFDGPHNALEPFEYVEAYKHIVDLIRSKGVTNIAFVWHSYGHKPYQDHKVSAWYPGDDYVDWVAISILGGPELSTYGDALLDFAKKHKKPVMVAEANPVEGIEKENMDVWDNWFVDFFSLVYTKNIKAISFINEDWPRLKIKGIEKWKDARLYNNEKISKAWFMETNKDRYLKQSPNLFEQLGYENKSSKK